MTTFGEAEIDLSARCARLTYLCTEYGHPDPSTLLSIVGEVLQHVSSEDAAVAMIGAAAAQKLNAVSHFAHWAKEVSAFEAHKGGVHGFVEQRLKVPFAQWCRRWNIHHAKTAVLKTSAVTSVGTSAIAPISPQAQ